MTHATLAGSGLAAVSKKRKTLLMPMKTMGVICMARDPLVKVV